MNVSKTSSQNFWLKQDVKKEISNESAKRISEIKKRDIKISQEKTRINGKINQEFVEKRRIQIKA